MELAWDLIRAPFRLLRILLLATGAAVWLLAISAAVGISTFYASLPDVRAGGYSEVKRTSLEQVNRRLSRSKPPRKSWTEIDQISRDLLYAIVLSEDSGFFEHGGVELDSILAATLQNLKKKKYESGASTITQQVVKNVYLNDSKSLIRKTKEVLVARDLENAYSKNQILEIYLNIAEFGPDLYGIQDAARHYFNKTPMEINAAEGAFLAIMLPSPRRYHYSIYENRNLTAAKKKKLRRILTDMLSNEFISPEQYREYLNYDFFRTPPRKPASQRKNDRRLRPSL